MAILSIYKYSTVYTSIERIWNDYSYRHTLTFAKEGDQNNDTIPEKENCTQIKLVDNLGEKTQSSSWLLKRT